MKNVFFPLLLLLFLSTGLLAQVRRGDVILELAPASPWGAPGFLPSPASAGGLYRQPDLERSIFFVNANYGVALLDQLVVGGRAGGTITGGEYGRQQFALMPYVRVYPLGNTPLMAYGELSSGLAYDGEDTQAFKAARLAAGIHLPVGGRAFLTPTLAYQINEGPNALQIGAGLQLLLRGEAGDEATPADFSRGRFQLGAEDVSVSLFDGGNTIGADAGAHFFVTDHVAVAALAGYQRSSSNYSFGGSTPDRYFRFTRLHLGAGARYYLTTARRLVWFADAGVGRIWESLDTNVGVDYFDGSFTYLTAGGGGQYFFTSRLSGEAGPQLRYDLTNEQLIPGINFGLRYLL